MSFTANYLDEAADILSRLDRSAIDRVVGKLLEVRRQGGRIFFLGVGGSAANASHAVNDFRK
ncbi:MAG: Sugar isomerase family protein, partial [Phycisphaerales bacterium]|nr:Sugar isomerase family protein [Phycisphaerales bacterium]